MSARRERRDGGLLLRVLEDQLNGSIDVSHSHVQLVVEMETNIERVMNWYVRRRRLLRKIPEGILRSVLCGQASWTTIRVRNARHPWHTTPSADRHASYDGCLFFTIDLRFNGLNSV